MDARPIFEPLPVVNPPHADGVKPSNGNFPKSQLWDISAKTKGE
jgi:hypothetical protein